MSFVGYCPPPAWTTQAAEITAPGRLTDVRVERLDDEALVITPTGAVHRLNATALLVWEHCDGTRTTLGIAELLTRAFEVDFETALAHVEEAIALFAELGLFAAGDAP